MDNMNSQPVCEIDEEGNKEWFLNGELHREDGPAIEFANGSKAWYLHGKYHREDGPAYEGVSRLFTTGWRKWYLEDERVQPEDVVDYNLAKGIFCYYDEKTEQLIFGGDDE